jgi:hypothetical protein
MFFIRRFSVAVMMLTVLLLGSAAADSQQTAVVQRPVQAMPLAVAATLHTSRRATGEFTVWVFRGVNGAWEKQEDRSFTTGDEASARHYMESVNAVEGWTATSNLPTKDQRSSTDKAANRLAGTEWTYYGSVEGCIFRFESGNRLWASSYFPQVGTWKLEGTRLTMEIENPLGEGINVFSGNLEQSARDIHLQVISSPYPTNIGVEVILKRLPLPEFS